MINTIQNMDCVEGMQSLGSGSIDMILTSPPYDGIRDYKGYSFDFESVADECYRILKDGGVMVWVVGDQTIEGSETLTSFRQALYFQKLGFRVETMIYEKIGNPTMPPKAPRYYQEFEYMFILSKGKALTFNALTEPSKWAGHKMSSKTNQREKDGVLNQGNHGYINRFKRKGNIWRYSTGGNGNTTSDDYAFVHPAMFPEKLARDHILTWSNENDVVLDPFMGSGTTAKMAIVHERQFIGFEISEEYCQIAERRISEAKAKVKGRTKLTDFSDESADMVVKKEPLSEQEAA